MTHIFNVIFILAISFFSTVVLSAPSADLLEEWKEHDPDSEQVVSHAAWQEILDSYLKTNDPSGVNLFDYDAVTKDSKVNLESYLESLQSLDPRTLNLNEQLAYWINLYNALTVKVVLDEYPVDSIKDIRFLTSPFGPWDKNLVVVAGEKLSLNDIEHQILRPIWQDPRIHFSVNCASIGCPNLAAKAFTSGNADELMEEQSFAFINHSRGVDVSDGKVVLSSIFDWYGEDFGKNQTEILNYIKQYYKGDLGPDSGVEKRQIVFFYDWRLNEVN